MHPTEYSQCTCSQQLCSNFMIYWRMQVHKNRVISNENFFAHIIIFFSYFSSMPQTIQKKKLQYICFAWIMTFCCCCINRYMHFMCTSAEVIEYMVPWIFFQIFRSEFFLFQTNCSFHLKPKMVVVALIFLQFDDAVWRHRKIKWITTR